MTAPTHMAFGILWAAAVQAGYGPGMAAAFGALLPDLDHTESSLGRVFFFLSHPINARYGHRGFVHSFFFWTPLVLAGVLMDNPIVLWIGLGAWSHILIDAWNVSGVRAFEPFTRRTVVCFKREWRIVTASTKEIAVCLVLIAFVGASGYAHALGGWRKITNLLVRSPKIAEEEYRRAGLKVCRIGGDFRWADGRTEEVEWLVIGSEKKHLICWDGKRVIRNPDHGTFLTARLFETERRWNQAEVNGVARTGKPAFFFDGKRWRYAEKDGFVCGTVKAVDGSPPNIDLPDIWDGGKVSFDGGAVVGSGGFGK